MYRAHAPPGDQKGHREPLFNYPRTKHSFPVVPGCTLVLCRCTKRFFNVRKFLGCVCIYQYKLNCSTYSLDVITNVGFLRGFGRHQKIFVIVLFNQTRVSTHWKFNDAVCVCVYVCKRLRVRARVFMCSRARVCVCVHVCANVCVYVRMNKCVCVRLFVCLF